MNSIFKSLALLCALLFFAMAGEAYAQGTSSSSGQTNLGISMDDLKASLSAENMSEYSAPQYAAIFGCPGGFFGGDCDATAFGVIVGQFNLIALIMGVIVVGYVVFGGAINTAASGEILGRNWSSTWLPIRTCMAFTLILPLSGTAPYSPSQMAALYAVVVGDNIATTAVKKVVGMVGKGEIITAGQIPKASKMTSLNLAGSVFCAANEWNALTNGGTKNTNTVLYSVDEGNFFDRDAKGNVAYQVNLNDVESIDFGTSGTCGSIYFPELGVFDSTWMGDPPPDEVNKEAAFIASRKVIIDELNAYATIEKDMRAKGITGKQIEAYLSTSEELPAEVVSAIEEYQATFQDMAVAFPTNLANTIKSSFGEVDANEFLNRTVIHYTDINKILYKMAVVSSAPNGVASEVNNGLYNTSWDVCFAANESCTKQIENDDLKQATNEGKMASTMPATKLLKKAILGSSASTPGVAGGAGKTGESFDFASLTNPEAFMTKAGQAVKTTVLEVISANSGDIAMDFSLNPLIYLHGIGEALINLCMMMIIGLFGLGLLTGNAGGIALGAAAVMDIAMTFIGPFIMTLLVGAGAMMFIGFIPIIVGIYGYLSIMVMAIQGVAAAPFAVVLLTSPEGQGGTNHTTQRFLLHLTHLFLAPLIYVLGAVATLAILVVGANILIFTFIYDMNFFGGDGFIANVAAVVFFVWIMYNMVIKTSTYQLVFQNEVMQILGGAFHSPLAESMAGEGKAAATMATNMGMKAMAAQDKEGNNLITSAGSSVRKGYESMKNKALGRK
jgi:conjugal transfer/type IV secretion protein DotA/TraY